MRMCFRISVKCYCDRLAASCGLALLVWNGIEELLPTSFIFTWNGRENEAPWILMSSNSKSGSQTSNFPWISHHFLTVIAGVALNSAHKYWNYFSSSTKPPWAGSQTPRTWSHNRSDFTPRASVGIKWRFSPSCWTTLTDPVPHSLLTNSQQLSCVSGAVVTDVLPDVLLSLYLDILKSCGDKAKLFLLGMKWFESWTQQDQFVQNLFLFQMHKIQIQRWNDLLGVNVQLLTCEKQNVWLYVPTRSLVNAFVESEDMFQSALKRS